MFTGLLALMILLGQTYQPEALAQAQRGVELARKQQYQQAIECYQKAVAIDPDLPGIHLNLGLAWFKLGKFQEAIAALQREKARSGQIETLLAMSYFGLHQYREAAQRLKPLAAAEPGNAELSYLLAKCYVWSGQNEEAMSIFKSLLERDPSSAPVHMLMGEALDGSYRPAEAIEEFRAAAKANPGQAEVHFGLGYLYWKEKRYEEAEPEFRMELKNDPAHAQAMAYLGDTLMKARHAGDAKEILTKALGLDNDLRIAHFDLGIIETDDKNYEAAVKEFRQAIRVDPGRSEAHYRLARIYQQMGRPADAAPEFALVKKLQEKKETEPPVRLRRSQ